MNTGGLLYHVSGTAAEKIERVQTAGGVLQVEVEILVREPDFST